MGLPAWHCIREKGYGQRAERAPLGFKKIKQAAEENGQVPPLEQNGQAASSSAAGE